MPRTSTKPPSLLMRERHGDGPAGTTCGDCYHCRPFGRRFRCRQTPAKQSPHFGEQRPVWKQLWPTCGLFTPKILT